jgi:hypothetical protein
MSSSSLIKREDLTLFSFSKESGVASHRFWRQTQGEFNAEYVDDAAQWGYWYLSIILPRE